MPKPKLIHKHRRGPCQTLPLKCFAENGEDLLQIVVDLWDSEDDQGIMVKGVSSNDLWDNIDRFEDLVECFGEVFWLTKDDYKKDRSHRFDKIQKLKELSSD